MAESDDQKSPQESSPPTSVLSSTDHEMSRIVRNRLLARTDVRFERLVVRPYRDGVCLDGVVCTSASADSISEDLRPLTRAILNRLIVCRPAEADDDDAAPAAKKG